MNTIYNIEDLDCPFSHSAALQELQDFCGAVFLYGKYHEASGI